MLINLQTFNTFRPKSACSDVTEIDTIKKTTDHPQIFTEGIKLMPWKVKNGGDLRLRFGVIQDLRQSVCVGRGRFFKRHLPSHCTMGPMRDLARQN